MVDYWNTRNSFDMVGPQVPLPSSDYWKTELAKAACSVLVTIVNKTRFHMDRVAFVLNSGIWRKEPQPFIKPETFAEFGSGKFNHLFNNLIPWHCRKSFYVSGNWRICCLQIF